jgi:electron transfer flavoprotein alpha subunit
MESILCLVHTDAEGSLPKPAFEALAIAKELALGLGGASVDIGLIGADVKAAGNAVAGAGARKLLGASGAELGQARYVSDAAAAEALIKSSAATIVVAPQTSRFARVLAGVAQRVGGRIDSHATGLGVQNGTLTVQRWYYRQRMEAAVTRSARPWIIGVDPGCVKPWSGAAGTANVEAVPVALPALRTKVTGVRSPSADEQTIRPDADLLFVAGAGWTKKQADGQTHVPEAEKLILGFLGASKASLGGSKSIVDSSAEGEAALRFMTHLNQIGQTGATPRHPKGLATCCHGEEPHAVGWRFIAERRAINKDAGCGWARGKADVLYVADAFEVMAKVNALLTK